MEVANRIHRIEVPMGERIVCVYLVVGEERLLIIDTGLADTPARFIGPYLAHHNIEPPAGPWVLVTHADNDHFGGNRSLKEMMPGAVLMCHTLDQPLIESVELLIDARYDQWATGHNLPLPEEAKAWVRDTTEAAPVDFLLEGGERLRLGPEWLVQVVHTPGHSRGHLTVYDAESRTALIGDAALWHSVPDVDGNPVLPPTYRYVDTYVATLKRLLQMPTSLLLTGHFPPYHDRDAIDFLRGSLAFVERVDRALEEALQAAGSGRTLRQLLEEVGPKLGDWPDDVAHFLSHPLSGHLERMEQYGKVACDAQEGIITYRWAG